MFNETDEEANDGIRQRRKRATAEAILEAARLEFEAVGFDQANLRAIAAAANVSAGSVVHHFGSKKNLLHAAFFEDLEAVLARAMGGPGPAPLERQLPRLNRAVFDYYRGRPTLSRTLLETSLFAPPPWRERFTGQVARVHTHVAALGARAAQRGELRGDADLARFGAAYLSFYYFALLGWAQGAVEDPAAMVDGLVEQHLEGLRPRGETP